MKSKIIETPYSICCPHCVAPTLNVLKNNFEFVETQKPYWLEDGDILPLNGKVTEQDWDFYHKHGIVSLSTWKCKKCEKDYFVLEITSCQEELNVDSVFYFNNIWNAPEKKNLISNNLVEAQDYQHLCCHDIIKDLLVTKYVVDGKSIEINTFVFNVVDNAVKSEYGMMACQAQGIVWEQAINFVVMNFNELFRK